MSSLTGPGINKTAHIYKGRFSKWGKFYEFMEPPFMATTVQTSWGQFDRHLK